MPPKRIIVVPEPHSTLWALERMLTTILTDATSNTRYVLTFDVDREGARQLRDALQVARVSGSHVQ